MADHSTNQNLFNLPPTPYFLSHSVGCLSKLSESTLAEYFLSPWKTSGGDAWGPWLALINDFDAALALLLDSEPKYFCPQQNLSSGFTKFLMSLPRADRSRHKVLIHADAFPSMGFVITALQNMGFTPEFVTPSEPSNQLQMWEQSIDDSVFCALITHVHSNTGVVSPVTEIIELCKQHKVFSVVDIAQSAGILPISLSAWNADAVVGSCVKWLCGGPGAGFMWLNPTLLQQLTPVDVGWFSHQDPFEMDISTFTYAQSAKRFWGGTPSISPYATALGGIQNSLNIGVENVLKHNRALMHNVLPKVEPIMAHAIEIDAIGGTLCLPIRDPFIETLAFNLKRHNVFFDQRKNVFRLSFHIYNSEADVDLLGEVFEQTVI